MADVASEDGELEDFQLLGGGECLRKSKGAAMVARRELEGAAVNLELVCWGLPPFFESSL